MYYEQMRASLKEGKIESLYIFQGLEEYLIEFLIEEIKKQLIDPAMEMMNFQSYTELPPVQEAGDFIEILPVMSERKMVVFRKCGLFAGNIKNKVQWEKIFSEIPQFNCVIIWEDLPEKGKKPSSVRQIAEKYGSVVEFPLQSEAQLKTWIAKIASSNGKTIEAKEASYIIATLERKMRVIKTELDKIIAYTSSPKITRRDIDAVIIKPAEESVFNLIDAMLEGKRDLCYNILYELRQMRQEPVGILSLLSGQIINIYRAKLYILEGFTASQAAYKLGGGYGAEKCARKADRIKLENLEILIRLCFEADKRIKQGLIEAWAALEIVIAEYRFY